MPTQAIIPVLVTMMLLTGVSNTLLTKYQDLQCVRNCDSTDPAQRQHFEQPVLQTLQMFIGEAGCWLVVGISSLIGYMQKRKRGYTPLVADSIEDVAPPLRPMGLETDDERIPLQGARILMLSVPAICDISGTTLMNVGLLFVAASIYQMTRGALVLFVGFFSVIFLRRRLWAYQWAALVIVVLGVAVVGLAGVLEHGDVKTEAVQAPVDPDVVRKTILGILMIAGAQIFTATQFVVEEFILERYSMQPLMMVGWEGIFGALITFVGMLVLHVLVGSTPQGQDGYFNAVEGWRQMTQNRSIGITSFLIMISIGGFNYFGLSVTRTVSATSRSTIDTSRTLFIWIVSLALHWETFKWLQIIGFVLLVYGTFLFNDVVGVPWARCIRRRATAPLLSDEVPSHS